MHLLEIGNTTVKIGTMASGDGSLSVERFADETWLARLSMDDDAIVCAVTGEGGGERILERIDPARLRRVRSGDFHEFVDGSYRTLESLGVDRILNLYGMVGDAVVISCGTAITVDAIVGGHPVFGAIMSGFSAAAEGLHTRVPALPLVDIEGHVPHLPATTSLESVTNGILLGTVLGAHGLARELAHAVFGVVPFRVVLTGGDAELMRRLWNGDEPLQVDDALLFRGMRRIITDDQLPITNVE